jgi:transposase InsO family protein
LLVCKSGEKLNTDFVIDTFNSAYLYRGAPSGVLFHSDRGTQYTANEFRKLIDRVGFVQSFSAKAHPFDNAVAENFFSILKSECINRQKIKDFDTAKSLIDDYMYFYNYERIQLKTKLTPIEHRRQSA